MNKIGLIICGICFIVGVNAQNNLPYLQPNLKIQERVANLLNRMTFEEKIAQLQSVVNIPGEKNGHVIVDEKFKKRFKNGIGAVQRPRDYFALEHAIYNNSVQQFLKEKTRLGIPALIQEEALTGLLAPGATTFPQPISLASSWDPALVKEVYEAAAFETRLRGSHQVLGPVLDLARDPRWGRMEETFGEDTYLVTKMGVAAIKGFQGETGSIDNEHVMATAKHFAGYGQSSGGRNFADTDFSLRKFYDEILPPFKAAIQEAHIKAVMPSHAAINGIPAHGNQWLLQTILRDSLDFKGFVVSDYYDIGRLATFHRTANDVNDAARQAIFAGVNLDLPSGDAYEHLKDSMNVDIHLKSKIDELVGEVLKVKFELGLFENSYVDIERAKQQPLKKEHQILAYKAAARSMILLKNKILPLNVGNISSIAVIGPNAHPLQYGGYSHAANIANGMSILEGIRKKAEGKIKVNYAIGCHITNQTTDVLTEVDFDEARKLKPSELDLNRDTMNISEAVRVAEKSDVVLLVLGGNFFTARESIFPSWHNGDRADFGLVGNQDELFEAIKKTGKPIIVVLVHGGSLAINKIAEEADAILDVWFSGQATGAAVADALFGDINPGGKLPVSIPRSAGHLPAYYSQTKASTYKEYLFTQNGPLFPFGFGLSYTDFKLEDLKLDRYEVHAGDTIKISIKVSNQGKMKGDEVIQLYVYDKIASVSRPNMLLKGFERITLNQGEERQVTLHLCTNELSFSGIDFKPTLEPGEFEIMVGNSSVNLLKTKFFLFPKL